ncbi:MAG: MFS transporter [Proteobacteria bacterium]|nr:MFS transporter [Pseudomonadota bacterium]
MKHEQIGWRVKLSFGVGQYAEGAKGSAYSIFLLFFYTSVQGLSGTMVGMALLIAFCFDGVTDPLMGSITDVFKSRWGRRHPFMYGAAIPFAVSFFLLFCPPDNLSRMQLFVWLTVFATLTRGFMTVYSVPHMAMNAELTNDYTERTSLSGMRSLFSMAGFFSVIGAGFFFFFRATPEFADGKLNPAAYPSFALVFSVAMVVVIWLSAIGTHSEIPRLPQAPDEVQALRLHRFFKEIKSVLKIGSFRRLFGAAFISYSSGGTMMALAIYHYTYFWGMTSKEMGIIMTLFCVGSMFGAIIVRRLSTFIGEKKQTLIAAMIWFPVFYAGIIVLRLIGFLPSSGHPSIVPLVAVATAVAYVGVGVFYAVTASMLADITDEHECVYGVRQEGIYYGVFSLMTKVGTGFGGFLAGIVTDISGVSGLTDPSAANPMVMNRFGLILVLFPIISAVVAVFIIRHYTLDRVRHAEILEEIDRGKQNLA